MDISKQHECQCNSCMQLRLAEMANSAGRPTLDKFMQYADPVKAQREFLNGPDK